MENIAEGVGGGGIFFVGWREGTGANPRTL